MNMLFLGIVQVLWRGRIRNAKKNVGLNPTLISHGIMTVSGVLIAANVMAAPITLPAGPLFFGLTSAGQFSVSNSINGAGNEGLWGIVQVTNIDRGTAALPLGSDINSGTTFFTNGQNGGNQITGIYYGVKINSDGITGTGGFLDLYWDDAGSSSVAVEMSGASNLGNRTAINQYAGFTDRTLLLHAEFTNGCDFITTHTLCIANGTAMSYQDVLSGLWATRLDSGFFTLNASGGAMMLGAKDIRSDSLFTGAPSWDIANTDIMGISSTDGSGDPIRVVVVPEPDTLTLYGLGVLGLGFSRWCSRINRGRI